MSAIVAISSAKLVKKLLATLKEWAVAGGMEPDLRTRKAEIVKWLVEHPMAIPEERRAIFVEKEADAGNKEPDTSDKGPGPAPVTPSDFAELRSILLGVKGQLDDVSARTTALEHAPPRGPSGGFGYGTGELEPPLRHPSPPPHTPHIDVIYEEARMIAPGVPDAVLEAVLQNKLSVRDFWKLDPTRSKDSHLSSSNSTGILANLSDALEPDAEVELAKAKLKYKFQDRDRHQESPCPTTRRPTPIPRPCRLRVKSRRTSSGEAKQRAKRVAEALKQLRDRGVELDVEEEEIVERDTELQTNPTSPMVLVIQLPTTSR